MNWGDLRVRVLLLATLPVLLTTLLLVLVSVRDRLQDVEDGLVERGRSLASQLAVASEYGLFSGNIDALDTVLAGVLREPGVVGGLIRDADGHVVVSGGELSASRQVVPPGESSFVLERGQHRLVITQQVQHQGVPFSDLFTLDDEVARSEVLGTLVLHLSYDQIRQARREIIVKGLALGLIVLIVAIAFAVRIGRGITKPIRTVSDAVDRIGQGDFDARVGFADLAGDLQRLAQGVNSMAERLATSQGDLRRQVDLATRELALKKEEAERSNEAKTRFLAAASHDLRQPIHALSMFVDQLLRQDLEGEARHLVQRVGESTDVLSRLLNALLDVSRLDAGALVPQPRRCALQPILDHIQLEFGAPAEQRGLRLRLRPTTTWVETDPMMLERVIMNLVSNAIRYTDQGSVMVAVRARHDSVRIEVRDSGRGIPAEAQQLVFAEFVQLGNPERDHRKGLGLGLSIVRRTCSLLKHPLELRSAAGRGSVFSVIVPRVAAPVVAPAANETPGESASVGRRVLLVDDEPGDVNANDALLAGWDYQVMRADSPAAAFAAISSGFVPDAVVGRQHLLSPPDGEDLLAALRARLGSRLPAIVLSAEGDPRIVTTTRAEYVAYLSLPMRPAKFRAALQGLLGERAAG